MMPDILSCVNLKGGVGKTALAVNLAAYAAKCEIRTLLIDCDPQTNATFCLMSPQAWHRHATEHGTLANVLGLRTYSEADGRARDPGGVLVRNVRPNLDLLPSHLELFAMDLDLAGTTARESILKRKLESCLAGYTLVICDCPPNLTLPTQNALAMSSHFIVPVAPDFLAGIGVGMLLDRVREIGEGLEVDLKNVGIVIGRAGRKSKHRESIAAALRKKFGELVFPTEIKERVSVSEAASLQKSVFEVGNRAASREFTAVCEEALRRMGWN